MRGAPAPPRQTQPRPYLAGTCAAAALPCLALPPIPYLPHPAPPQHPAPLLPPYLTPALPIPPVFPPPQRTDNPDPDPDPTLAGAHAKAPLCQPDLAPTSPGCNAVPARALPVPIPHHPCNPYPLPCHIQVHVQQHCCPACLCPLPHPYIPHLPPHLPLTCPSPCPHPCPSMTNLTLPIPCRRTCSSATALLGVAAATHSPPASRSRSVQPAC